jgi:CubicO group peptidase (beta-lactamase class C family)
MHLSRRTFTGGAFGLALGSQFGARALAQTPSNLNTAIEAIRAHAEANLRFWSLPALTLAVTTPNGFASVENFGFANSDARTPISPDTLFQIGSISKSMTSAVIHQLAAEGRLGLAQRVSDILPAIPLPTGNPVTVQHLLDHAAGLADSPPLFAPGGLWTAYAPGAHWHYSNAGYEILGKIAEHVGSKPLAQLLKERIFTPLGMARTRGAIVGADRTLYAQGYEAADPTAVFARGVPLAPASWVDVTFGAGSVASTGADMIRFMRSLADAAQGRGGLGLSPVRAKTFSSHAVVSDSAGMNYGNGLMHVGNAGRAYLHHTGGMVSFSSSFHVDVESGVGAFASTPLSAFAEYRPRLLTRFAVDALTNAMTGRPLPSPPLLDVRLPSPEAYIGQFEGPGGSFEVRTGAPLIIVANGQSAPLQPWGGDIFRTTHPSFRQFSLMFDRTKGFITGASWGPSAYLKKGIAGTLPPSSPALAKLAGRYVDDSPWYGSAIVVERGGKLWIGTETPMTRIGENLWRVGNESWSPERASFADFIDGRPQALIFSGEKFLRHDV